MTTSFKNVQEGSIINAITNNANDEIQINNVTARIGDFLNAGVIEKTSLSGHYVIRSSEEKVNGWATAKFEDGSIKLSNANFT
jgi:hypothetical protein